MSALNGTERDFMVTWFDVSKEGLSKLVERRGSHWIFGELLQNAWDAPGVTKVTVTVEPHGKGTTKIVVEDDSSTGFDDLSHAFTLFAESKKKTDPSLRGRFNLGEKLVLSLCRSAEIASTSGTIIFDDSGRRMSRKRREKGTTFTGILKLNRVEAEKALGAVQHFIAPAGVETMVNGIRLERREPVQSFVTALQTEIADEEGVLRKSKRKTKVSLYLPLEGRVGSVYEMGIPVCETGDQFDVDIGQKVPQSLERETLLPSFLRDLRVAIVNNAVDLITTDDLSSNWVDQAIGSTDVDPTAVGGILTRRFGEKIVSFDVSDREANDRATAAGYVVLHGSTFNKEQWKKIRETGVVRPAGQVTPTPKPFSNEGDPAEYAEMTREMHAFSRFVQAFARETIGQAISVEFLKSFNAVAAYGGRRMSFNVGHLKKEWFEGPIRQEQIDLVIHELGHEFEGNHLSKSYNDALTLIGAKAVMLALKKPCLFDIKTHEKQLEAAS
jgi:hypothetical protein